MKTKKLMKKNTDNKEIIEAAEAGWGNLHYDLLEQILQLLPVKDLIGSISLVCRHWKLACGAFLFWKDDETLDLSSLKILLGFTVGNLISHHRRMHQALKSVLNWETMKRSPRSVRTIIFAPHMHINHSHLAFLAKRTPKLKKLVLPRSRYYTLMGFSRIIQKWRELEDLSIGPLKHDYSDHLFPTLGKNCKNLSTLHIFGSFPREIASISSFLILDEKKALLIAENLPKLKVLTLDETYLHQSGVSTLLSECKNLVKLDLNGCRGELYPSTPCFINSQRFISGTNKISVEIKSCRLKNCLKWYLASSSADHRISYTTQALVNQLWAGDRVNIEMGSHW